MPVYDSVISAEGMMKQNRVFLKGIQYSISNFFTPENVYDYDIHLQLLQFT